jgi:hypothetical protein
MVPALNERKEHIMSPESPETKPCKEFHVRQDLQIRQAQIMSVCTVVYVCKHCGKHFSPINRDVMRETRPAVEPDQLAAEQRELAWGEFDAQVRWLKTQLSFGIITEDDYQVVLCRLWTLFYPVAAEPLPEAETDVAGT